MTKPELLTELTREDDWIQDRKDGVCVKYRKLLNPKKVPEGFRVLARTTYTTPRNNKVIVFWVRVKRDKLLMVETVYYFEYQTPNGKKQYLMPLFNNRSDAQEVVIFTVHAMQRVQERAGMPFLDLAEYECNHGVAGKKAKYTYNGKETLVVNAGDKGLFILEEDKWGYAAATFISNQIMKDNQTEKLNECEKYTKEYQQHRTDDFNQKLKDIPRYIRRKMAL